MNGNSVYSAQPEEDRLGFYGDDELSEPARKACETPTCNREAHRDSEGFYCAFCEAEIWRDELKARWFETPPDPERTAEAEMQVRIWDAIAKLEGGAQ